MIQTSFGRSYLQLMMAKGLGLLGLLLLLLCWIPGFLLFQILCIVSIKGALEFPKYFKKNFYKVARLCLCLACLLFVLLLENRSTWQKKI